MQFTTLIPLVLGIFIPLIVLLYILKQKAVNQPFSSNFLWQEALKSMEATTPWEKLKNNLLMYLQLLAIIFAIFTLMKPYLIRGGEVYQHVIMIIDVSGSMKSQYQNQTRFDAAVEDAKNYVQNLNQDTNVTLIAASNVANIEVSNATNKELVLQHLNKLVPDDTNGNHDGLFRLVDAMISQWESYEVVYFTDSSVTHDQIEVRLYYEDIVNGTVDFVRHRQDEQGLTIMVQISNTGVGTYQSDINLYGDDVLLDIKPVQIEEGDSTIVYFTVDSFTGKVIRAELNEKDGLIQDNTAYDIIEDRKNSKVLLVTEQNIFLEKGIQVLPSVELYKTNSVDNINEEDQFDLYVFDNIIPDQYPREGNFLFIGPEETKYYSISKEIEGGVIRTTNHQINRYLEDFSIPVNRFSGVVLPNWATSLMEYNEYSPGFIGNYDGRIIGAITFELHQSDFPLKSEFPIFIHNLVSQMLDIGMLEENIFDAGSLVNLNPAMNGDLITIMTPNQKIIELPIRYPMPAYEGTKHMGIYTVKQVSDGITHEHMFAVNFPKEESLKPVHEANNTSGEEVNGGNKGGLPLQSYLIWLLIAVILVEWIYYKRR